MIEAVAAANPKTVVVLNTVGSGWRACRWISRASGVVEAWYPGQFDGEAIAAIFSGMWTDRAGCR